MKSRVRGAILGLCAVVAVWVGYQQYQLDRGQKAFTELGCASCHFAGGGPNLTYVAKKYDADTMVRFIQDPEAVYKERGKKPLNSGYVAMHKVPADPADVRAIATFLRNMGR